MRFNPFPVKTAFMLFAFLCFYVNSFAQSPRTRADFDMGWRFHLGDASGAEEAGFKDAGWRELNLPHDWSIEGKFDKNSPATVEGGALTGGIGWYRKTFTVPGSSKGKKVYIDFDGVYEKSTVWINGHQLKNKPNGYISFEYDLTPYLNFGGKNVIAVKVDNSVQPNSRWYAGSGIYRNVWLLTTNKIAVDHWGTYVTTPKVSSESATVEVDVKLTNQTGSERKIIVESDIYDHKGKEVGHTYFPQLSDSGVIRESRMLKQQVTIDNPLLWSPKTPYLYKVVTRVYYPGPPGTRELVDEYTTPIGIRYFDFDADKGFSLNGKHMKILGVCDHHDLGSLGAALNDRALQRQLEMLKAMGCNGIRTSHNPPAPELLDLADRMGFLVMDEAFDCWEKGKVKYDYHLFFKEWHKHDLEDQILRDRNHPSVIIWSIGNEIPQQGDPRSLTLAPELAAIVHSLNTCLFFF